MVFCDVCDDPSAFKGDGGSEKGRCFPCPSLQLYRGQGPKYRSTDLPTFCSRKEIHPSSIAMISSVQSPVGKLPVDQQWVEWIKATGAHSGRLFVPHLGFQTYFATKHSTLHTQHSTLNTPHS